MNGRLRTIPAAPTTPAAPPPHHITEPAPDRAPVGALAAPAARVAETRAARDPLAPVRTAPVPACPDLLILGTVDDDDADRLQAAFALLAASVPGRLEHVVLRFGHGTDRPCRGQASLSYGGVDLAARVVAPTRYAAVDLLAERVGAQLAAVTEGRPAPARDTPAYRHRPPAQRRVVRRKTCPTPPIDARRALAAMYLLDHDFYLYLDAATGRDALVCRPGYDRPGIRDAATAPPLDEVRAARRLGIQGRPLLFFRDPGTGRGQVLYRRHDGHYGLLRPAPG